VVTAAPTRASVALPRGLSPALAAGGAIAFVLAVDVNSSTSSFVDLLIVAAAMVVAALVVTLLFATPAFRPIAVILAGGAAWLLPQRDDIGAAAAAAAFFAAGLVLALPRPNRREPLVAIGGSVVVVALLRFFDSQVVLLIVAFVCVLVGAIATALARMRPPPRPGDRTIATLLTIVFIVYALYVGAVSPHATWFGGGTIHGPTTNNEVALTFDDGPNIGATLPIMRILDQYGTKGTFFEVGKAVAQQPQISRALVADGQLVGNHSYHHDSWTWLEPTYPELKRTQNEIKQATGMCPGFYRPPHGYRTPFIAHLVDNDHMHMVLWSVSAGDWASNDAQLVAGRVLAQAKPGSIILLHDGLDGNPSANRQVLVRALPLILEGLRAQHLTPVRLDQLLGESPTGTC
jgi:peptidoglycan/xylan/chitin deacetylase (PgdA/CDA1 family)